MDFQALFNKARVQVLSLIFFATATIAIFLPWISACAYSICYSASLSNRLDFLGILVLVATLSGLAASAYSVNMAHKNVSDAKKLMLTQIVNTVGGLVGAIFGFLTVSSASGGGMGVSMSWGIGFILFLIATIAAAVLNGMRVVANKDLAKEVVNQVKSDTQKKIDAQRAPVAQPTEAKKEETPVTPTAA